MNYKVFFLALVIALCLQGVSAWQLGMTDDFMWGDQAHYVQTGNPKEFDFYQAYGHPGGPIIEGVILIHSVSGFSYRMSIEILLVVLGGFISAAASLLCYLIWRKHLWWIMTAVTLSIDHLIYDFATPPTYIVSLLAVFLFLLTWYMYKNKERLSPFLPALWATAAGLAVATRADIASFFSLFLGGFLFLTGTVNLKKMLAVVFGAIMVFVLADPFMWFMPVQHIKDLLVKVVIHYALFVPNLLTPLQVGNFSVLAFISIAVGAGIVFYKKIPLLLPVSLFTTVLAMTAVLYNIFLSAKFQDPRYFLPILLVWEILLPFYVFSVVPYFDLKWRKMIYYGFVVLFFVYHFALFFYAIWLSHFLPILI